MNDQKKSQRLTDMIFLIGLLAAIAFMLWKSPYGYGAYDEPFYLSIPHRLVKGDGLLTKEWNFGQLSAFLLWPLMKLYLAFSRGTEGIVLAFRYIYIAVQCCAALYLYLRVRKKRLGWLAVLLFLIFCPYDIMALSYNTMGIDFILLTGILLACGGKKPGWEMPAAGLFFAAAVLCNPFLIGIYAVYTICAAGGEIRKKKRGEQDITGRAEAVFTVKSWASFTAGAVFLAVLFLAAVLSRSEINEIIRSIPLILQDPEHTSRSLPYIIKVYLGEFYKTYGWYALSWPVLAVLSWIFRKNDAAGKGIFALSAGLAVLCMCSLLPEVQNSYNFLMVPLSSVGLCAYLMTRRRDKSIFLFVYVLGILYSFFANYASNQGMHAIAMTAAVTNFASVLMIGRYAEQELEGKNKALPIAACILLLIVQTGVQAYAKSVHAFWEDGISSLDARVAEGPLKGVVTSREKAGAYAERLADIRPYAEKDEGVILFVTRDTWCYLYADMDYGTFSPYISGSEEAAAERWRAYYEVNPDKIPDYIYIPKDTEWDIAGMDKEASQSGYRIRETAGGYHLSR